MDPSLVIRRERPADREATRTLHDQAFGAPEGGEHAAETVLLDGLRADGDVIDELTFVAELGGDVVGHVVCSRASMGEGPSVGLGPIAVSPDRQGEGIGSALVAAVLVTADQLAEPSIVLLGDPGWYAHFGFEAAAAHGVGSPGPWEDRYFQVKRLQAWRPELAGAFRYAPAFARLPA
ncbi:MAG: N-acetyltransferase [Ornithinibacter sp.]